MHLLICTFCTKYIVPWHEHIKKQLVLSYSYNITNVYFKLAYVAKLSIIISTSSTASAYNQNMDKQLVQLVYKTFSCETFVYQKILLFTKVLCYEKLALYGRIHSFPEQRFFSLSEATRINKTVIY